MRGSWISQMFMNPEIYHSSRKEPNSWRKYEYIWQKKTHEVIEAAQGVRVCGLQKSNSLGIACGIYTKIMEI